MEKQKDLIKYFQNDICHLLNVYNNLKNYQDIQYFNNFVKIYGKQKVANILYARGLKSCNIQPSNPKILNEISKNMVNKATGRNYKLSKLYSKYFHKVFLTNANFELEETDVQIVFDCLVQNESVDIKNTFSLNALKQLIEEEKIVLLGVKEKPILSNTVLNQNLIEINSELIKTYSNGFIEKNICPSIKYCDNSRIMANIDNFYKKFPKLLKENVKIQKEVVKELLIYELQNQQIVISDNMEKTQTELMKTLNNYKMETEKYSKMLRLNQLLLKNLSKDAVEDNDFDFQTKKISYVA